MNQKTFSLVAGLIFFLIAVIHVLRLAFKWESGSERLGGSDVGKRSCSSYRSVLSFRGPEAEQEKLESAVLIE